MSFQLDTSGIVRAVVPMLDGTRSEQDTAWSDLSPFAQGYIEAALQDIQWPDPAEGYGPSSGVVSFSDLAPETLARIIEDCERWLGLYPNVTRTDLGGKQFWQLRTGQIVKRSDFPPLHVTLSDDGTVHLSTTQDALGVLKVGL